MKKLIIGLSLLSSLAAFGSSTTGTRYATMFKCTPDSQKIDFSHVYGFEVSNSNNTITRIALNSEAIQRGCNFKVFINDGGFSAIFLSYSEKHKQRYLVPVGDISDNLSEEDKCEDNQDFIHIPLNLASSAAKDLLDLCLAE
jgi:hypothetical protein